MLSRRSKREDDYIGPAKGWAKFFHRLFLLITFPLRRPLVAVVILLVLFLAPTFKGVKPAEVHLWYWHLLQQGGEQVKTQVSDKAKELADKLPVNVVEAELAPLPKSAVKVVDLPQKESRRKMFERAKSAPVAVEATVKRAITPEPKTQPAAAAPAPRKLALNYLSQPEILTGKATVTNANELIINGKELFLYGIYAEPESANGAAAAEFLTRETAGKQVRCEVNAYTFQDIPTAVCFVGVLNLNRELVNRGWSKNVALD